MKFNLEDFNKSTTLLAAIIAIVTFVYGIWKEKDFMYVGVGVAILYFLIYFILWLVKKFLDPYKFIILDSELTVDILDDKGKEAIVTKEHKIKAVKDGLYNITDIFKSDAQIDDKEFSVSPGSGKLIKKLGEYHLITNLDKRYKKGDIINRFIQIKYINSFPLEEESWSVNPLHPTRNQKVKIIFPKNRQCQSYDIVKQVGMYKTVCNLNTDLYTGQDGRKTLRVEFPPSLERNRNTKHIIKWNW